MTDQAAVAIDGRAVRPGVAGIAASVLTGRLLAALCHELQIPSVGSVIAFYAVIFGGLWWTCRIVSRRYGSGSLKSDFGLQWRPSDIGRALLGYVVAAYAGRALMSAWAGHTDRLDRMMSGLGHLSDPAFAVFAVSAVVAAPLVEELTFRGMLQRALVSRLGAAKAVVAQGLVFGAYHLTIQLGWDNLPYSLGLVTFGIVAGWMAHRTARLGPGMTMHVLANMIIVSVLASRR